MTGNRNQETGIREKKKGFSLVEILVVLTLLGLVAVIAGQGFFSVLKGSSKSDVTIRVRESGNYALSLMERKLHSAVKISCIDSGQNGSRTVKYTDANGTVSQFSCQNSTITDGPTSILPADVIISECYFVCMTYGGTDSVKVNVTFTQAAVTSRPEEAISVPLQTQIRLRN